jgi:hypothetical protein
MSYFHFTANSLLKDDASSFRTVVIDPFTYCCYSKLLLSDNKFNPKFLLS